MTKTTVGDVMTRDVVSVRRFTPYKDIVRILLEHGVSAVPVLDEYHTVEGIVSEADLIDKEAGQSGTYPEPWELLTRRGRSVQAKAQGTTAGELMSTPVITVGPDASLSQAARLMRKHAVKRLPVVDDHGAQVGIVSRADLLTPYLRPDEDLRDEVVQEVLIRQMAVEPFGIEVNVRDGEVTLTGELENDYVIQDTLRLTRELDGVVAVVDQLRLATRPHEVPAHGDLFQPTQL
jgi:CBS-domain-containing membrane protein